MYWIIGNQSLLERTSGVIQPKLGQSWAVAIPRSGLSGLWSWALLRMWRFHSLHEQQILHYFSREMLARQCSAWSSQMSVCGCFPLLSCLPLLRIWLPCLYGSLSHQLAPVACHSPGSTRPSSLTSPRVSWDLVPWPLWQSFAGPLHTALVRLQKLALQYARLITAECKVGITCSLGPLLNDAQGAVCLSHDKRALLAAV